jgi:drug/metabolite transporter (DMT)-like permease
VSTPQPETTSESAPPPLKPLDPPTVPFAVGGMILWAIAWLAVRPISDDHPSWPRICIAGFLAGIVGLAVMIVHDRNRRARRNAAPRSDVD